MAEITQERLPSHFEELDGSVMSNFDHVVDEKRATKLINGDYFADYPGWNFHGKVWWDRVQGTFRCEVWRHRSYAETISGTLQEVMQEVSSKYGAD